MNETRLSTLFLGCRRFAVLGCLLGVALVPAYADLVLNGTFLPVPGTSFVTAPPIAIPDWTVSSGSVDWIGSYWAAPVGASIDLDGNSPGAIQTTLPLATVAGQYLLTFDLNANPDGGSATKTLDVIIGGGTPSTTGFSILQNGKPTATNYTHESLVFTATGPTTLTFSSTDAAGSPWGPVLADVSVVPLSASVPESSLGALALGLSGLIVGFIAVRRRKIA